MGKAKVSIRLDKTAKLALNKIAEAEKLNKSQVIEQLILKEAKRKKISIEKESATPKGGLLGGPK